MKYVVKRQPKIDTLQFAQNTRTNDYGIIIRFYDAEPMIYNATRRRFECFDNRDEYDYSYLKECLMQFYGVGLDEIEEYIKVSVRDIIN